MVKIDKKHKSSFTIYFLSALVISVTYWWVEAKYLLPPFDPLPNIPVRLLDLPLHRGLENLIQSVYTLLRVPLGFQEAVTSMLSSFFLRIVLLTLAALFWGLALTSLTPLNSLNKINSLLKRIKEKNLLIALFLIPFLLTICISTFLYHHEVHIADSVSYLFQAKVFASGHLYARSPSFNEFFDYGYIAIVNDGDKWYANIFPGHSFMLLWGILLGIPWAVGPLLVSLSILLIYLIGKEMYGVETGLYSALFGISSPFLMFISATYMSHSSSLFFISLALFFFVRTIKYGKWFDPLLTGIFLGIELNTRTLISITLGFPLLFHLLYAFFKDKKLHFKTLILFATPCIIFSGLFLFYNYRLTGAPFLTPYEVYRPNAHFGFGEDLPQGGYTPLKGLLLNLANLYNLNETLFGWPGLSLFFILVFLLSTKNKWDYLLLTFLASTIIVHYFHFAQDTRRWYGTLPALLLLTLRGIKAIPALMEKLPIMNRISKERMASITVIFVCFLFLQNFTLYIPRIVKQYRSSFWDADKTIFLPIKEENIQNAVIFMDVNNTNYDLGFSRMSPDLKDDIIFVRNLGEKNIKLMQEYPFRKYYLLSFDEPKKKAVLTRIFNTKPPTRLEKEL